MFAKLAFVEMKLFAPLKIIVTGVLVLQDTNPIHHLKLDALSSEMAKSVMLANVSCLVSPINNALMVRDVMVDFVLMDVLIIMTALDNMFVFNQDV